MASLCFYLYPYPCFSSSNFYRRSLPPGPQTLQQHRILGVIVSLIPLLVEKLGKKYSNLSASREIFCRLGQLASLVLVTSSVRLFGIDLISGFLAVLFPDGLELQYLLFNKVCGSSSRFPSLLLLNACRVCDKKHNLWQLAMLWQLTIFLQLIMLWQLTML